MARFAGALLVPLGIVVAASCGNAFTAGGTDGGIDGTSPADAAGDTAVTGGDDVTSSGSGDSSAHDAPGETAIDTSVPDAPHDVAEEQAPPPPTCGGALACVPSVPSGWAGPVELYAGSSAAPPCTTDFTTAYDGNSQLDAPAASCSCQCNPSVTQCASPTMTIYEAACVAGTGCSCTGTSCDTFTLQAAVCTTVAPSACTVKVATGMNATAPVPSGSCPPVAGKSAAPITWGTSAQACSSSIAIAQVDCPAGDVCAPKAAAPYGSTLCISQAGDIACPTQGYTQKQTFYGGADDQRTCTACTCGSPTGASCDATIDMYTSADGSCTGTPNEFITPFSCDPVNDPVDMRLVVSSQGGSCVASTVSATGSATPISPTTFCCLP